MKITDDHWLDIAIRRPVPGGVSMRNRHFLVIHFTSGATGESSINYWKSLGGSVCAHIVIERDGTIKQCRPFNKTCGHAGKSRWTDPQTGRVYVGLNSNSIGIELANAGYDAPERDAFDWAKNQPGFASARAKHKNESVVREWEVFPGAQVAACEMLSRVLCDRYNLDDVVGHDDIAPDRKVDPGPLFPMTFLRKSCGIDRPL